MFLALVVTLIAPLVAAALVLLLARLHRPTAAAALLTGIAALGAMFVLVLFRVGDKSGVVPGILVIAIALAAGAAIGGLYWRSAGVRSVLAFAAIIAPLIALLFLFGTPARRLLAPSEANADTVAIGGDAPPIVMIVFDEFPVVSLLDETGHLDADTYPSFARLAGDATFFTNATTVHTHTMDAVPALLSGKRARPESLPTWTDHPTNLLALLGDDYRMHVAEVNTGLCPSASCKKRAGTERGLRRLRAMAHDLFVVQAHLVVPQDMAGGLPGIDAAWRNFGGAEGGAGRLVGRKDFLDRGRSSRDEKVELFRGWVDDIEQSGQPTVHFLHTLLPHYPWRYLQDGRTYDSVHERKNALAGFPGIERGRRWTDRAWPVAQGYQRHLLQVQFVDRLLGEVLDQLEREGLYDQSLIVLAADHGAAFVPGQPLRDLTAATVAEIAGVPVFVKAPGQTSPTTSDDPIETVDVLPTILDLLGVAAPPGLEGHSALDDGAPPRTSKRIYPSGEQQAMTFAADPAAVQAAVERKMKLFASAGDFDVFSLAPPGTATLIGQAVPPSTPSASASTVAITDAAAYDDVDLEGASLPVYLKGAVVGAESDPGVLAVALNGAIVAVTITDPVDEAGNHAFRALLPPDALRQGANDVEVFIVGLQRQLTALPPAP